MKLSTLLLILCAATVVGCGSLVDKSRAVRTLTDEGYKDVTITDEHGFFPAWAGCSDSDDAAFDATATNVAGKRVAVTVCCGFGVVAQKGCTVRH